MRHRALLFGIIGTILVVSAFRRHLQAMAIFAGLVSMMGFIILAWLEGEYGAKLRTIVIVDIVGCIALGCAALWRTR